MTLQVLETGVADAAGIALRVLEAGVADGATVTLRILEAGLSGAAVPATQLQVLETGVTGSSGAAPPATLVASPSTANIEPGEDVTITATRTPAPASVVWRVAFITGDGVAPVIRNQTVSGCSIYAPPATAPCTVTIGFDPVDAAEQLISITCASAVVFVGAQPSTAWVAL